MKDLIEPMTISFTFYFNYSLMCDFVNKILNLEIMTLEKSCIRKVSVASECDVSEFSFIKNCPK